MIWSVELMLGYHWREFLAPTRFQLYNHGWINRYHYSAFNAKVERSNYALDLSYYLG